MKYIDEAKIGKVLEGAKGASAGTIEAILQKSKSLQRLTLEESAALLMANDEESSTAIFQAAAYVKNAIYGKRVVLFAPLYISNACSNNCLYCAFRRENTLAERRTLSMDEIREQVAWLLRQGHKRILLVAGERAESADTDYFVDAIKAIYSVRIGGQYIRRVNINCAPLGVDQFRRLKEAGIGTYQIFQETYHEETYRLVHPDGPKADPDNRMQAIESAFRAGIDDIGMGVLYGLYEWQFETLALLMHIEHVEEMFHLGPHTISVPRLEPAPGAVLSAAPACPVSDHAFKRIVAVLRLAVPYTGIILSTRERAELRDELFSLGVSQISAGSRTSPGGYDSEENNAAGGIQFAIGDQRSLDEVVGSLIEQGMIPSFCAACYRKERTGEAFMDLAKPGMIKGMCSMNALITLKEYLDDFASPQVRSAGYRLIKQIQGTLSEEGEAALGRHFSAIERGVRDEYV